MPRAVDLQLLTWAVSAGAIVAWAASRRGARRAGAGTLAVAWVVAAAGDWLVLGMLPEDLSLGVVAVVLAALVALVAVRGAGTLVSSSIGGVPVVVALAGGSAAGLWGAVPETSIVLLVAGSAAGLVAQAAAGRTWPSGGAVRLLVAGLAGAALVGSSGNGHALLGGLLCLATFVVLGVRPPGPGRTTALVTLVAVLLHLASALVAARHVGVNRSWGAAPAAVGAVVVLAVLAAGLLRPRQRS